MWDIVQIIFSDIDQSKWREQHFDAALPQHLNFSFRHDEVI
jgi:hypothetical protein